MILFYQVKEYWQTFSLDLVNYQNKCKLIRGWDDLFTKCREHMNSVAAMKLSPYYKVRIFMAVCIINATVMCILACMCVFACMHACIWPCVLCMQV